MKALASATLDYGTAAQIKFNHNAAGLTVRNTVSNLALSKLKNYKTSTTPKADRVDGVSMSLNVEFGADNTLFVTYSLPSGKPEKDYTFTIDGNTVTPVSLGSGYYKLQLTNISPNKLGTSHIFNCTDGTKNCSVETSVLGYANLLASQTSAEESLKNLAKAMYLYSQAAIAYAG
ncbi:MAG: hypothetical protein IKO47_12940 [Ruminococcus sp.]|nr:hypothetical protein [Ruminococcus sp.]